MKIKYLTLLVSVGFFLLSFSSTQAQQTSLSLFNRYNWQLVNPAAIDRMHMFKQRHTIINGSVRQQWVGLEGSPVFYQLSFEHMPQNIAPIKWGFNVFNDQTDKISTYGINLNGSYYFKLDESRFRQRALHLGISTGFVRYQVKTQEIKFKESEDPIANANLNQFYMDVGLGIFYRDVHRLNRNGFYAGLSLPQTFGLNFEKRDNGSFAKEKINQIYFIAGSFLTPYDSKFTFEPSTWIRYAPGVNFNSLLNDFPFGIDLGLRAYYFYKEGTSNSIWVGSGYSTNQNLKTEFGFKLDLGEKKYALQKSEGGTMQIGIGWEMPLGTQTLNLGHSIELSFTYGWDYEN